MKNDTNIFGRPYPFIQATSSVYNPWYEVPINANGTYELFEPSCLLLPKQGMTVYFRNNQGVFTAPGVWDILSDVVYRIREYLSYRTFVNFNTVGVVRSDGDLSRLQPSTTVNFRIQRVVPHEEEVTIEGQHLQTVWRTLEDTEIRISSDEISQYLAVVNNELYFAIASYLLGCDNPRYFLVEFYKAVEVIKNTFSSETMFLKSLAPYGVTRANFRRFRQFCNDDRQTPLNIGRHAPMPGKPVNVIDLRHLLEHPPSLELFEFATTFCRQVIDAYIQLLLDSTHA